MTLYKKRDVFYFSQHIPVDLRSKFSKTRFAFSLKTKCEKQANELRALHKDLFSKQFFNLRKNKKEELPVKRDKTLANAHDKITGERAKDYGDAYENHERVATMWSSILGINVSVKMVYLCLLALKISRLVNTPNHTDSWIDICGYGALGAEEKDDK